MGVKKQRELAATSISEAGDFWFRLFLKTFELSLAERAQGLSPEATAADYGLAAMRAVKHTLLDTRVDKDAIRALFAQVALEDAGATARIEWTADLNKRRFELIDGDIQGSLSQTEQLELAGLTQLMRDHVDTEANLPFEGAQKLHRRLSGFERRSRAPEQ